MVSGTQSWKPVDCSSGHWISCAPNHHAYTTVSSGGLQGMYAHRMIYAIFVAGSLDMCDENVGDDITPNTGKGTEVAKKSKSPSANVSHLCHVPACVNPEHLFMEDAATNSGQNACQGRAKCLKSHGNGPVCLLGGNYFISREAVDRIQKKGRRVRTKGSLGFIPMTLEARL